MKKCPNCLAKNNNSNEFCQNCGQDLTNIKSNSFRNFIIIIIVIVSLAILGLIAYFVLNNLKGNLTSSTSVTQESYTETEFQDDTIVLLKEELTKDQKKVISYFGYPDQFTVVFDEDNNNKRIDSWMFFNVDAIFIFQDGTYYDSDLYYNADMQESDYELFPQDFIYGMTPSEVEFLIGEEADKSTEEISGLNVLSFGEGQIICIFNPDNRLIIASKQNKLLDET